jgi:nucleoside-diphosphate-sugar epimerase
MKIFVTGGTGFIGGRLIEKLIEDNHEIVLLMRNPDKAGIFKSRKVTIISGDLFDRDNLKKGMIGCDWVFHLAAFTKPWSKVPEKFYKTNVTGTINILETALDCNVKKVVLTSTAGTMSYSHDGKPVNELTNINPVYHTLYESTKAEAEQIARKYCQKGLDVVIVNPTRVYGPGRLTKSNSLTKIIKLYIVGFWRILPGKGDSSGNYVFIDNVVEGHLLAANNGVKGERYILGGENLSFNDLFRIIGETAGRKRKVFTLSFTVLKVFVKISTLITKLTGMPPVITGDWLDKYSKNWIMSSEKAINEIGYKITPFSDGVRETIRWLKSIQKENG